MSLTVFTVGHSNTPICTLLEILERAGIQLLVDVRQYPMSRRNPQFNSTALADALAEQGIEYVNRRSLGGRRTPSPDSNNAGLSNPAFRGFADHMQTPEFSEALDQLIEDAEDRPTAIMCAEALPFGCHRSLISDALVGRGVKVSHLIGARQQEHAVSPHARVEDGKVTYPALL